MCQSKNTRLSDFIATPKIIILLAIATISAHSNAALTYTLTFDDPLSRGVGYYSAIESHVSASLNQWGSFLNGSADLGIQVRITDEVERASGRSFTSGFMRNDGIADIFEQGMAYELRTGIDPNGSAPDVELQFNPDYLLDELWFDPNPAQRIAPIAASHTDAMSVFLHEFGHAIAFNGWEALAASATPNNFLSPWDELVTHDGEHTFFHGLSSENLYGGPIPVTNQNNFHIGNLSDPGSDLIPDLMNGMLFYKETRYFISALDLAIISDLGVAVIPEPSTYALFFSGLIAIGCLEVKKHHQ